MSAYRYLDHPVDDPTLLVKITIPLDQMGSIRAEHVFALPLGGDIYRIENVPFLDPSIGLHDEVIAIDIDGEPEVVATLTRRTHVRFTFELDPIDLVEKMDALYCRSEIAVEGCGRGHFTANLPDRRVATEFQQFLETYAAWFERYDDVGAALATGSST